MYNHSGCLSDVEISDSDPVHKQQPIMLHLLSITLLKLLKKLPMMLNIMPITTAIMPQFVWNFIVFNN